MWKMKNFCAGPVAAAKENPKSKTQEIMETTI